MTKLVSLNEIGARRVSLSQVSNNLELALSAPSGDPRYWRSKVVAALTEFKAVLSDHVHSSEDGFLKAVAADFPNQARKVSQLLVDHERLQVSIDALFEKVVHLEDDGEGEEINAVRLQAIELLGQVSRHKQRSSDLIYEAYKVDVTELLASDEPSGEPTLYLT